VQPFDARKAGFAGKLFRLQYRAYLVESRRIGWRNFPPLKERPFEFRSKLRHAFGMLMEGRPVGLLCYEALGDCVQVTTLVVDPMHFRRGVATALMHRLLECAAGLQVGVMTARRNRPAMSLYRSLGFVRVRSVRGLPRGCVKLEEPRHTGPLKR
jgi:ribosomal protein S18 acetylase RimI-like enzyme